MYHLNGVPLEKYEKMIDWVKEIQDEIRMSDFFPSLPKNEDFPLDLFDCASDEEKRMLFRYLLDHYVTALRHWKMDRDTLYPKENPYPEDDLRHYMKQGWEFFY